MKILIVDDNKENSYLLETLLKGHGYDVVSTANGEEALDQLRLQQFDLIISDIMMPVMDGFQLCRQVKQDTKLKDIPFVFYTATYTDAKDEELALKMGADKFIRKPIEPSEFVQEIQGVLKNLKEGQLKQANPLEIDEKEVLKLYDERLVNKLERKILQLEEANAEIKKAKEALAMYRDELEIKVKERTRELADANKQLKEYGRRITQIQEEERKRIAYELHDNTAQYLSILKLELDALLQSGKIQDPMLREKIEHLEKDASRAFDDVRRYSHDLRPGVLEHLGLQAALEQIVEDINKLKQIPVELHVEGSEPEVSEDVRLAFFRIAQEALNNVRKHARASGATINLRFNHKRVLMTVSDDGSGFDVKEAASRAGGKGSLGLMSMRERASLINATLKIESEPGKGTKIIVKAKL